jgi:hypothetical protein
MLFFTWDQGLTAPSAALVPFPFSLTGAFPNEFLTCLIFSWRLFLEGPRLT